MYGQKNVNIRYTPRDLLWKPVMKYVRFVAVIHPTKVHALLMSTDLTLSALDIIDIYQLRFKIELTFKQTINITGNFSYHFWMKFMKKIDRKGKTQYLHKASKAYRDKVKSKINAYHRYIQIGFIAQGLLQLLSASNPSLVWKYFGSWIRTIRPGVAPSERVVSTAMRNSMPEFLSDKENDSILAKFIMEKIDI